MGNKVSAVNGVRSPNFFQPGNAVNEIWLGKLEIISRLPFGDSDMAQAGWPRGDFPKIPWRPFIIPLRAAADKTARSITIPASETSRKCLWPAFVEIMSKVNWERIFWIVERAIAIPAVLFVIFLHFGPSKYTQFAVIRPCLEDDEDEKIAFQSRFKRQAVCLRAWVASSVMAQVHLLLLVEPIVKISERTNSASTLRFFPIGFEGWFYFILTLLGSYSHLRLLWAYVRL
ncbi:uncharacterized protein CIMG_04969 [Coccidioides immitis RS]|uniref:Uncharacterized protein n=7 Tax=Coccidioides TaxID=5500 RepID=J3KEM0_COCIM|nr:uncharacterized protein CIMG_04969 [Coccidioides immitis RS]XP_003071378.1 hypothetical protein CPC735_069150 [Coccidioides posadasii C735 delta SOWgp]EFW14819.1 conserved hypothetical protein [Coccidioides posadasii str. Silveira]KMP05155.1 hypothetical protein CIRG_04837 [Coccidioides immitis RMSCC 2394]KMU77677.1 hypothetical protein CISG_01434 [Coccidioides immitis RMSCC 3703]KMU85606.1 hypothetical protein CIHG_03647 [Coccidioides immitis H538.4]TPX21552.1 hypothetical protein DIZ76_0|eukprot:XP_003071378.1 hypothetical protein CPC735_069150 [Coccidioides posadasii C735 delta SOWgp]